MDSSNRKNIAILAFALIVVMLGYGMVIPLFPFYIAEMGAGGSQLGLLIASRRCWNCSVVHCGAAYQTVSGASRSCSWACAAVMLIGFVISLVWLTPRPSWQTCPHGQ